MPSMSSTAATPIVQGPIQPFTVKEEDKLRRTLASVVSNITAYPVDEGGATTTSAFSSSETEVQERKWIKRLKRGKYLFHSLLL